MRYIVTKDHIPYIVKINSDGENFDEFPLSQILILTNVSLEEYSN